jgi:opacity protein-like surface antigen
MPDILYRSISTTLAITSLLTIFCYRGSANEGSAAALPTFSQTTTLSSSIEIAQNPNVPTPEQLNRQRDAERVLKNGENLQREIRDSGSNRNLEERVGEQINKVRESGSDPQKVREADSELTRLRQQYNRFPSYYYYDPFYPYYSTPGQIIFTPGYGTSPLPVENRDSIGQDNNGRSARDAQNPSSTQLFGSAGFTNGSIAPSIGVRYNYIGLEVGAVFNQDSLPGAVNDFSLPSNFFFNDLGIKKLSPQWGLDLLGFVDVAPRVAAYGSVGLYFQNVGRIAQSLATNELYKQTNTTNTTGAFGGGVIYSPSDSLSVGLGYHSVRGVNVRLGVSF